MDELSYINFNGKELEIVDSLARNKLKCLIVTGSCPNTMANTVATSTQINNNNITNDMVVIDSILSNPSAQKNIWSVDTYDGYLTITGTVSETTDITLYLAHT